MSAGVAGREKGQGVGNQVFSVGAFVSGLARERLGYPQMLPEAATDEERKSFKEGPHAAAIDAEAKKIRDELRAANGCTSQLTDFIHARVADYLARTAKRAGGPTKADLTAALEAERAAKAKLEAKVARLTKKAEGA